MRKKCSHGRQKSKCKDCGGSEICAHKRIRAYCKECVGSQVCEHNKYRDRCIECNGTQVCQHRLHKTDCKKCGTHWRLHKSGFSTEEIKRIGLIMQCEFPRCGIKPDGQSLCSDHAHDAVGNHKKGWGITHENYRGEVCQGCNRRLKDLDAHPEWANDEEKEYLSRRPFRRSHEG
jgi:hypothetical protein